MGDIDVLERGTLWKIEFDLSTLFTSKNTILSGQRTTIIFLLGFLKKRTYAVYDNKNGVSTGD